MATKLSDLASVKAVVSEMTLEEKARLVMGSDLFSTAPIERLGIPRVLMLDGGSGMSLRQLCLALLSVGAIGNEKLEARYGRTGNGMMACMVKIMDNMQAGTRENLTEDENALLDTCLAYSRKQVSSDDLPSCLPDNSMLAATWNPDVALACGRSNGREACAYGVDVLLGSPCVNIQRDPRGGRGFEGYSEDPYLAAQMSVPYAVGVQEQGVLADAKHFAANNQETDRRSVNEIISQRALREIYFPAFRANVEKAGIRTVMTAYNWINGEACAHNRWMNRDVLRGEWGFDGFVVSDWGGAYDPVKAIQAGNDVVMPGPSNPSVLVDAVESGRLAKKDLDAAVTNFLRAIVDMPCMKGRQYTTLDSEAARAIAYQAAAEGVVLLKNDAGLLPLSQTAKVGVFGERSIHMIESGAGSGHVHTNKTSSLLTCIQEYLGESRARYGVVEDETDTVIVTVGADGQEGGDRPAMRLDSGEAAMLRETLALAKARNCKTVVLLNVAAPIELTEYIDDIDALLMVYFPGEEGGRVAADVLFGRINPSGKLQQTYPRFERDCPAYRNFPGYNSEVYYGEGIYVGYRHYDIRGIQPLFPFGYGLSYTNFAIEGLRLSRDTLNADKCETITALVQVTNRGKRAGKEVVQMYLADRTSTLDRPLKELRGFQKVFLEPGESKEVSFTIDRESLVAFDPAKNAWVCEPGEFRVLVGNSSRDIYQAACFWVVGRNPYGITADSLFGKVADNPEAADVVLRHMPRDVMDRESLANLNYFSKHLTFRKVWDDSLAPLLSEMNPAQKDAVFQTILREMERLDVSESQSAYREKIVF